MRLDNANRSFLAMLAVTLPFGAFVICGALGNVLVPLILKRASLDGPASLPPLSVLSFVVLVALGLGLAGRSLARQAVASRRLTRRVRALARTAPEKLVQAARQAGLGNRVDLVDRPEAFSFVYGMLAPRVTVSRGLLESVHAAELRAVLEHERYHVSNLDPLKIALARALTTGFFLLPALGCLRARYVAGRELAADERAIALCGRRPLAGALLKAVRGPEWSELDVVAAIGGSELLEARVTQLETGSQPRPAALSIT